MKTSNTQRVRNKYKRGDIVEIQEFPNVWYKGVVENPRHKFTVGPLSGNSVLVRVFERIQFSGGLMLRAILCDDNIRLANGGNSQGTT